MAIENSIKKTIEGVLELTNKALDAARHPAFTVAAFMVYATAVHRPGISKDTIYSEIISDNATLGINTGQMPDGTDNVVNQFVNNLVEKVVDTLKDDAMVECVIPTGSLIVKAEGGNAGGPVVAVGTNINDAKGYGLIR